MAQSSVAPNARVLRGLVLCGAAMILSSSVSDLPLFTESASEFAYSSYVSPTAHAFGWLHGIVPVVAASPQDSPSAPSDSPPVRTWLAAHWTESSINLETLYVHALPRAHIFFSAKASFGVAVCMSSSESNPLRANFNESLITL